MVYCLPNTHCSSTSYSLHSCFNLSLPWITQVQLHGYGIGKEFEQPITSKSTAYWFHSYTHYIYVQNDYNLHESTFTMMMPKTEFWIIHKKKETVKGLTNTSQKQLFMWSGKSNP